MNNLQSGTPSSQLTPQSYSNSNQTKGLQESTNLQQSDSISGALYSTDNTFVLRVEGPSSTSTTLGVNTLSNRTAATAVSDASSTNLLLPFMIVIVAGLFAAHYFTKYLAINSLES